jgi:hypothetical protein
MSIKNSRWGLSNSPDIFQECMTGLMSGLEFCRVYIDDLLAMYTGPWSEHLTQLEQIFNQLQQVGFKANIEKSFFGKTEFRKKRIRISRLLGNY